MKITFEFNTPLSGDDVLLDLSKRLEMLAFVYKNMAEKDRHRSMFAVGAGSFTEDGGSLTITEIEP